MKNGCFVITQVRFHPFAFGPARKVFWWHRRRKKVFAFVLRKFFAFFERREEGKFSRYQDRRPKKTFLPLLALFFSLFLLLFLWIARLARNFSLSPHMDSVNGFCRMDPQTQNHLILVSRRLVIRRKPAIYCHRTWTLTSYLKVSRVVLLLSPMENYSWLITVSGRDWVEVVSMLEPLPGSLAAIIVMWTFVIVEIKQFCCRPEMRTKARRNQNLLTHDNGDGRVKRWKGNSTSSQKGKDIPRISIHRRLFS